MPTNQIVKLFINSENESSTPVEIRNRESGELIPHATISAGEYEKISSDNGIANLPTRWNFEYPLYRVTADGFQGVNQRLVDGMPSVVFLNKSAGLQIKVIDESGKPVPNAIVRPFPSIDTSFANRNIRRYVPRWLQTNEIGHCLLEIEPNQALQIFAMHPRHGFGQGFTTEVLAGSIITITLHHQPHLQLSFIDSQGKEISPDHVSISCHGIDAQPKPSSITLGNGSYSISNPAFLDVIRIQPQGHLPLILKRKTFQRGALPYQSDDAGGMLVVELTATHPTRGVIVDKTGSPHKNQRFQFRRLLPGASNNASETFSRRNYPGSGWIGIESVFNTAISTDSNGRFALAGLASGTWVASNSETSFDLPLGSGGQNDAPFVIPHLGDLKIITPGKTAVHLTVLDDNGGIPIPEFTIRLTNDQLLNGSVGFSPGRLGRWDGWVRNHVINNLEVAATGYRSHPIAIEYDSKNNFASSTVRLAKESVGKLVFIGPEADQIVGKTLIVTDVGNKGMAMFGDSRWSHKFQVADNLEELFPAPVGDGLFTIMQASFDSAALTFEPRTFSYLPGETIIIQVVHNDG